MSRLAFYLDEDAMDADFVRALRSRGIDAVTALDAGMIRREDEDHSRLATEHGRALFSFNIADFYEIHQSWLANGRSHAGIVLAQQKRYSLGEQVRRIVRLMGSRTAETMRSRVEFLSKWGAQ